MAKALQQVQADEAAIGIAMLAAVAGIGHPAGFGACFQDIDALVDDQTQQHLVNRRACGAGVARHWNVACLDVEQYRIDFPQPIATGEHLHVDRAAVLELSMVGGAGQRHGAAGEGAESVASVSAGFRAGADFSMLRCRNRRPGSSGARQGACRDGAYESSSAPRMILRMTSAEKPRAARKRICLARAAASAAASPPNLRRQTSRARASSLSRSCCSAAEVSATP